MLSFSFLFPFSFAILVCVCVCCIFAALWRQQRQTLFGMARSAMKCIRKRIPFALKRVLKLYGVFICCHLQTEHYEFQLLLSNCCASMGVFVCDVILCGCDSFTSASSVESETARVRWVLKKCKSFSCLFKPVNPNYTLKCIKNHDTKQWKRIKPN